MPSLASPPLTSAEQLSRKLNAQSRPSTTGIYSMNTLLSGNDSAPGAVFWTLVKLWRPLQLMPGLQNGKSNGTASAARQPSGRREASPQTNASPLVTTNLGLSGRLLTDYGLVKDGARHP
ncbi:hypothetical protein AAFF_G00229450 [Aldrovandia affinis]|uniref:Uncharacterized protein n=1 Tax=Aldrovandia affinis TaxID=143900 RepID=A0AAD7SN38_9TELE|nr:hypothetical protein AAFF_G00338230 [Aldrovandia affinis]KAJ8409544.1 hypothetical protein AAFF_G00229450 [Aldrovandia affinis]